VVEGGEDEGRQIRGARRDAESKLDLVKIMSVIALLCDFVQFRDRLREWNACKEIRDGLSSSPAYSQAMAKGINDGHPEKHRVR